MNVNGTKVMALALLAGTPVIWVWLFLLVSWLLVLVLWLRALFVLGKNYREYQNRYGQRYQSHCEEKKVTRVTLKYLRRLELLLRKLGQRGRLLNKFACLLQKPFGKLLGLFRANRVVNRGLKMHRVGSAVLNVSNTTRAHGAEIGKAAISEGSGSPESKGVVDVHSETIASNPSSVIAAEKRGGS
jgi:hypothetical protein